MDCELAREALSALLDGEEAGVDVADVDRHLAHCPECRAWREASHTLARRARLHPRPAPRPSPELLAAVVAQPSLRRRWASLGLTRLALGSLAIAQLGISVPVLLFGHAHTAPAHVAHELGSFDVAVAIGFLVATRRPSRALGMVSLVGTAAALLVGTAVFDLLLGRTDVGDEAPHLLVVAGWLLLRRLAVLAPPSSDRPRSLDVLVAGVARRLPLARLRPGLAAERYPVNAMPPRFEAEMGIDGDPIGSAPRREVG